MRTSKKIVSSVLAACMLASTSVIAGAAATGSDATGATANPYVVAVEALDAEYTYSGNDLGATYSPEKTVFKVWSPTATEVTLNRYATGSDSEAGAAKLGTVASRRAWRSSWCSLPEPSCRFPYRGCKDISRCPARH